MLKLKAKIKIAMIRKGISGAEIARQQGVDRSAVSHVLAGRSKSKRLRQAIAEALGLRVEALWPEKERE